MPKTYADVDFNAVTTIQDLSEIFKQEPYDPAKDPRTRNENPNGILEQYRQAHRSNYENAAQVFYVDRTLSVSEKRVQLKTMWFDEDGNRTERPVRPADGE